MKDNSINKFNTSFNLLQVFLNKAKKAGDGKNIYYNAFYKFLSTYKQSMNVNQGHRK